MTIYQNCVTLILADGRVIICKDNGYSIRTIDNDYGSSCTDGTYNNLGCSYWKKQALNELKVKPKDIVIQMKGNVVFKN